MMYQAIIQKSCFLLLLLSLFPLNLFGQQDHVFALQNKAGTGIDIDSTINENTLIKPFGSEMTISGLAFSGEISLHSDSSLVRIILMDNSYNEYLVYETYPILSGSGQFSVNEAGEESLFLDHIIPVRVSIELVDASVYLKELLSVRRKPIRLHPREQYYFNKAKTKSKGSTRIFRTWVRHGWLVRLPSPDYHTRRSLVGLVVTYQTFRVLIIMWEVYLPFREQKMC